MTLDRHAPRRTSRTPHPLFSAASPAALSSRWRAYCQDRTARWSVTSHIESRVGLFAERSASLLGRKRIMSRSEIYARPDVYDMEYAGADNQDAEFFAKLLERVESRRVLEFACGSGRVTFTLAAALPMIEIVGVDSS